MPIDNENSPAAQGTVETPEASGNPNAGVEARIAELTAKFREAERVAADKDAQIAALIQAQLANQQAYARQESAQPQVEVDPEFAKAADAYVSPKLKQLQDTIARLEAATVQAQFAQLQASEPPEVVKRAQELQLAWQRSGKQGWVPQDALVYARGEHYARQSQANVARTQQQNFNQASNNVSMASAPTPSPTQGLPKNIDSLPLHERIALREKAIADIPWED